jgi:hypothetical protein
MQRAGGAAENEVSGSLQWAFNFLSWLLGTLAIVALTRRALETGRLTAPFVLVMDAYAVTVQQLLGWAEPHLQSVATGLGGLFGWRPTLHPHWRDVFVIAAMWGVGYARAFRYTGRPWLGGAVGFSGIAGALVGAAACGTLPLNSENLMTQLLIVLLTPTTVWFSLAVPGVLLGAPVRTFFSRNPVDAWLVGITPAASTLLLFFAGVQSSGIIGYAISMFLIGTIISLVGIRDRFYAIIGLSILGGFVGATLFFAIDAGLKLLGG